MFTLHRLVLGAVLLTACSPTQFAAECEAFPERCCDLNPAHDACRQFGDANAESAADDTLLAAETDGGEDTEAADSTLQLDSSDDGDAALRLLRPGR